MGRIGLHLLGESLRKRLAALVGKSSKSPLVPERPVDPASRFVEIGDYPRYIERQIMLLNKLEDEKRKHLDMYDFLKH